MASFNVNRLKEFILQYYIVVMFFITAPISFDFSHAHSNGVLWSDAEGYYMYLPAIFIYGGFEDIPVRTVDQFFRYPGTNKYLTKYTCGVAVMELPFFLAGHFLTKITGRDADGYTDFYIYSILLAAVFYAWLGFFFLKKTLERYYKPWIVFGVIMCLFWGTNMYYYITREAGMSHIYSFCLFAVFLYLTPRFYEERKTPVSLIIGMGALAGLIVLIRPTNIVLLLYFFFYGVKDWETLTQRVWHYRANLRTVWLFPIFSFLVFIPQMIYWQYISGEYILYSYGDEGFIYWSSPKVNDVLFNIKNGWLMFTPMAFLMIIGLLIGSFRRLVNMRLILVILLICLYTFSSWWCWWFGGGFGHRSFIEFYTLLAFPLAYLLTIVYTHRSLTGKVLFSLVLVSFIYYNQGLIHHKEGAHYNWATWNQTMDRMMPYWPPQ
jgi:hypothetical protein